MHPYQQRTYRHTIDVGGLTAFRVVVKETDLWLRAEQDLTQTARESILLHRGYVEQYIRTHPEFADALVPWEDRALMPRVVRDMVNGARQAGVGPMAAVAGAIAQRVGHDLLKVSPQVIVENGGDVFAKTDRLLTIGLFAAASPLSMRLGLQVDARTAPTAVCTSSGTVGHSLSFGQADAVCVVSRCCALADAAATAVANQVKSKRDISKGIDFSKKIKNVDGVVIVVGDQIGIWGKVSVVPLQVPDAQRTGGKRA